MFGFSKKRFLVTLGLSILVWVVSLIIQGTTLYKVKFSLFSGSACEITGFPIATCTYSGFQAGLFQLVNIFFWFWIIHLFSTFIFRSKK